MGAVEQLERAVVEAFPSFVQVAVGPCDDEESPFPEESREVARAVPKRRREFLSGRACAHRALRVLGLDGGPIGVGSSRQPLWPLGALGSIAHAGEWSGAVLARGSDAWGLGFDLEMLEPPLADDVDRLVRTQPERDHISRSGHPLTRHLGKMTFSVKESVYKCLFPRTGWPLEFHDLTVALDFGEGAYTASIDEHFGASGHGLSRIRGRFRIAEGYVVTGLCISADGTSL